VGEEENTTPPPPQNLDGEQLTLEGNPAITVKPFSAKEFTQLWNDWVDANGLPLAKVRNTDQRRRKFEARQKAYAKEGAYSRQFWADLLTVAMEADNGRFIGNGKPQEGYSEPWKISVDWLIKNDTNIAKLLEAIGKSKLKFVTIQEE